MAQSSSLKELFPIETGLTVFSHAKLAGLVDHHSVYIWGVDLTITSKKE